MFPIDPRQAVLASASNTCTAGIMTLHFPSLALPIGHSRPARSPQSWMGQTEAQYKLTPSVRPFQNSPTQPHSLWMFPEREEREVLPPARVTVSLQNHTSPSSMMLWGAQGVKAGMSVWAILQMAVHLWGRLKPKLTGLLIEIGWEYM